MRQIVGLFAPLPTPFTDDGSTVGEIRLARLMGWLRLRGVAGFAVCTEAGEYPVLSLTERKHIAELAFRDSHGAPVLVNVTAVATTAALDLAQHAARHGAFGGILAPPRGDFTDNEIHNHIASIAHHANLPFVVVDPLQQLTPALIDRLSQLPNVSFPSPVNGIAAMRGGRAYTDEFSFPEAVLSPVATFAPKILHPTAAPCVIPPALRNAGTPRVIKAALSMQGLEMGPHRGPYLPLTGELRGMLEQLVVAFEQAA
jgi:dihydrodipicolinate synthase/N-acetylneuraminate lyase